MAKDFLKFLKKGPKEAKTYQFGDPREITRLVKEKEDALSDLRDRMQDDFDLLVLTEFEPKDQTGKVRKGYESYTSSAPRNHFDKVMDGLNRAALSIQIKLPENATEEERRAASTGELYLFGALADIDRRLSNLGEPPLREGLGHFMGARGRYALKALVYTPKGAEDVIFDVTPWDPMHVTWEMGPEGLLWVAYKTKRSKAQILAEYGITIGKGKETEVIDWFDAEKNCVVIDSAFAKEPIDHNIGHVPVNIGAVGSMPTIQTKDFSPTTEHQGDSVWSASRGLYEPKNKWVSWVMDNAKRSTSGSLVIKSKEGDRNIVGDPYASFTAIPIKTDDDIKPLELPKMPAEVGVVLGILDKDEQESTLPSPYAYGGTDQALSGRALSILSDATRSVYSPRTGAMARAYTWLCEELLVQFKTKGVKVREVTGYKPDGEFFRVKVKPSEVDTDWFIEVTVKPQLPRDREAEILQARMITESKGPTDIALASKQYAREDVLQMRDPDAEEDRVLAEMGKANPVIMVARTAAAMKKRGDEEGAERMLALIQSQTGGPRRNGAGPPSAPALDPELIKAIVQALINVPGGAELANALIVALGGGGAPGPQGPAGGPVAAPASAEPALTMPPS